MRLVVFALRLQESTWHCAAERRVGAGSRTPETCDDRQLQVIANTLAASK
jgi:hypothetical protein